MIKANATDPYKETSAGWFLRCGGAGSYTYEYFNVDVTHWYAEADANGDAWVGLGATFHGNNTVLNALQSVGIEVNGEMDLTGGKAGLTDGKPFHYITETDADENIVRILLDFGLDKVYGSKSATITISKEIVNFDGTAEQELVKGSILEKLS